MHILGKIFVWTVVLLAAASIVLTSKLIANRNVWLKRIEDLKADNERNAAQIAEKRLELEQNESELANTLLGWDRYWPDVTVAFNQADVSVQTENFGTNQGFDVPARAEKPVVYLFRPLEAGGFDFIGPFQATKVLENQSALKPQWRIRTGDVDNWEGAWRVRALIPSAASNRFLDLKNKLTVGDELLAAKQHNLDIQTALIAAAEENLAFRMSELVGSGQPDDGGLMGAMEADEEQRNSVLADVDRLRNELKTALAEQTRLAARNVELTKSLPQPAVDVGFKDSDE